jgi:nicotinamide mononucleotide (NMN) deamidase PncC
MDFSNFRPTDVLNEQSKRAHESAYELLNKVETLSNNDNTFTIVTAESLTGGLLFSTLVDTDPVNGGS